jgi:hypothetical protein
MRITPVVHATPVPTQAHAIRVRLGGLRTAIVYYTWKQWIAQRNFRAEPPESPYFAPPWLMLCRFYDIDVYSME